MQSPLQEPLLESLQRFVSVIEGYTDVVVEVLGERMMTSHTRIDEALRRHRLYRGDSAAFVDRLLGLERERHRAPEFEFGDVAAIHQISANALVIVAIELPVRARHRANRTIFRVHPI